MIKKRGESKKKTSTGSITPSGKVPKMTISTHPEKMLFRLTSGLLGSKVALNAQMLSKGFKSGTATPSSKIKRQSKENMYQSVFYSKKTS